MKCFECGKDANVLIEDEVVWESKISFRRYSMIFKKALCKKHFEDIIKGWDKTDKVGEQGK